MIIREIVKANKDKKRLAEKFNVSISSIVWTGNNRYILVKNGKEFICTI